eukprot:366221-Chlamydomonas_euryale.AAC.11
MQPCQPNPHTTMLAVHGLSRPAHIRPLPNDAILNITQLHIRRLQSRTSSHPPPPVPHVFTSAISSPARLHIRRLQSCTSSHPPVANGASLPHTTAKHTFLRIHAPHRARPPLNPP